MNNSTEVKKIEDYLHLYLGCEVQTEKFGRYTLVGYDSNNELIGIKSGSKTVWHPEILDFKPILRPLSSMSEEEGKECSNIMFGEYAEKVRAQNIIHYEGEKIRYLLSKGFDIFNLRESGLCIYESDLKS